VRTAENPGDTAVRQLHPLTRNIMEAPKAKGGLGMVKTLLSYCKLTLTLTLPLPLTLDLALALTLPLTLTLTLGEDLA